MKKISSSLIIFLSVIIGCSKTQKSEIKKEVESFDSIESKNTLAEKTNRISWYDSLVVNYIKFSDKDLIRTCSEENSPSEWILDRTEENDSTKFMVFNIGKTVTDENNSNPRFSSCGWIYIDSLKRKVYEYDLANDTLIYWKKH